MVSEDCAGHRKQQQEGKKQMENGERSEEKAVVEVTEALEVPPPTLHPLLYQLAGYLTFLNLTLLILKEHRGARMRTPSTGQSWEMRTSSQTPGPGTEQRLKRYLLVFSSFARQV